jgi:hypothetical protein
VVHPVAKQLEKHLTGLADYTRLDEARQQFLERGVVRVPFLAPEAVKDLLAIEVEELITSHGRRHDLVFPETGNSQRHVCNVRRDQIKAFGSIIPGLYCVPALREVLTIIAGEEVLECPTNLSSSSSLRWTSPATPMAGTGTITALPWSACVTDGGFVQCISHTEWDKNDPRLHWWFVTRPIYSIGLVPGDSYLMRTDTTLHRVYPVTGGRRLIVNMSYASSGDLTKQISHETMDNLWPAGVPPITSKRFERGSATREP